MNDDIWTPEAYRQFADKIVGQRVTAGGKWVGEVTSASLREDGCKVAIALYPQEYPSTLVFSV